MAISDRTATATRNLERQQWKTTYERNHTGIGPVNQYKLDNHYDKEQFKINSGGVEDDNIVSVPLLMYFTITLSIRTKLHHSELYPELFFPIQYVPIVLNQGTIETYKPNILIRI